MANLLPEYWISAYLDDELPASLKQQAEARLTRDETARRELEEMREVRRLLQALPSKNLPSGFSASVLSRCERESLIPAAESSPPRTSVKWGATIGTLVATAAMLFLAVKFIGTPTSRPSVDSSNRNAGSPLAMNSENKNGKSAIAPEKPETAARKSLSVQKQEGQSGSPVNKDIRKLAQARESAGAGATNAKETPRNNGVSRRRLPAETKKARGGKGNFESKQRLADETRNNAHRGAIQIRQAVPYLKLPGDRVAVIEVTAEDVQEAVTRFESLLKKQAVRSVGTKSNTEDENRPLLKGFHKKQTDQRRLVALYVESTPEQLAAVMGAVDGRSGKVRLALKPPVAIREVTLAESEANDGKKAKFLRLFSNANNSFADAVRKGRYLARQQPRTANEAFRKQESGADRLGLSKKQKAAGKSFALKSTGKNGQKRGGNAAGSRAKVPIDKGNPAKKTDASHAKPDSFQMRFWLTDTWLAKKERARATGEEKSPKIESRVNEADSGARQTQPMRQGPLRVMFVFRQKP